MYQYTFSKEDTDALTDKTKKYSELLDSFKDVDKKYSSQDNGSLELKEMTFTKPTDEEIKKQAENNLYDYKETGIQGINDEYTEKQNSLENQISSTLKSGDEKKTEAKELYSSLKQDASNDATKRGLARSSIVINVLDAFDQNMIKEYNKINEEISSTVDSLNNQKALLNEQKQNALNSFDITYAVKLSEKIDEINKELLEQEQKVIEYNNEIAEKEAEYEQKRKENALDYADYVSEYGVKELEEIKQNEKYMLAKDYFMSMPKEEALKELESNRVFNAELGSVAFNKLKVILNARED